ncbi:serine hydrolase domain-containing protein [Actinomyces sp. Marseille-P3109]|uniref:serine hydrolase domain-containing protein n=1 Tax=Actinomyces sp. Marseille-P3109 TaxID=2083009 RepID=UPI001F286AD4|nr:serine hydrolase domain-containing protein [Actinomyces sp. Marseille-P3109]
MSNTRDNRTVHDRPQSAYLATDSSTSRVGRRRSVAWRVLAVPLAAAIALGAAGGTASAAPSKDETTHLKSRAQGLVDAGYPAALAAVSDAKGESAGVAVGKGNLETGQAPPLDGEVRIGSNTKTFVAVVVMQMVQEGKVGLDEPIETYLPGLIKGEGIDGSKITVRQLLQHTSGLPEYTDTTPGRSDIFQIKDHYIPPRDLLDTALGKPAAFEPGTQWAYTNTNYVVLGMLVERVSQRPVGEQIDQRIIKKLGLSHTYFPAPGDRSIKGTHPQGYHLSAEGKLEDITEMDPAWAWAAGAMVSTPSELNTFFQAVFDGRLLTQSSIDEMKNGAVDASSRLGPGTVYGLGLIGRSLTCGGTSWGHGGTIHGYQTNNAVGPDGTAAIFAVTALPSAIADQNNPESSAEEKYQRVEDAVDATLCHK